MKITIHFMLSILNVDYVTSFCKRGKYAKFLVGKKWFYFFFDNLTVEIEDTNKIVKTIKSLKTQFKKYSGGLDLVFLSHNDRDYGHPAVCGRFTVAQRNSESGSETLELHVSQQVNIDVC